MRTIPLCEAIGTVLGHDITEITGDFKGRAFKKGHIIKDNDISHLQRLGKENLYILELKEDEIHEDDAVYILANSLKGKGVQIEGPPSEGRINLIAQRNGLLRVSQEALMEFNMLGDVMCATLHNNTPVSTGQVVAGTRTIPLVVKTAVIHKAVKIAEKVRGLGSGISGVVEVREMTRPKAGIVITGNEVYRGRIKDSFAPVITEKLKAFGGEIVGVCYAPDDEHLIEAGLRGLISSGADLLIATGGMSVDPDDVTRFAIKSLGAVDITYGSSALPGAMFLMAYLDNGHQPIPILGVPACGIHNKITVFDVILPRVLAGERIGKKELAGLGHGGLCLKCNVCRYPHCPFGKG